LLVLERHRGKIAVRSLRLSSGTKHCNRYRIARLFGIIMLTPDAECENHSSITSRSRVGELVITFVQDNLLLSKHCLAPNGRTTEAQ
jgi:hypothetical protein